jgi:hypothetical protein
MPSLRVRASFGRGACVTDDTLAREIVPSEGGPNLAQTGDGLNDPQRRPSIGTANYGSGSVVLTYALTARRRTGEPRGKGLSR